MSDKPIFAVEKLTKSYQGKKRLNDISLVFLEGAKIGVIGQNGVDLLRIMAGDDKEYDGVARLADGKTVGYVPQEPKLIEDLTVRENVEKAVEPIRNLLKQHEDVSMKLAEDSMTRWTRSWPSSSASGRDRGQGHWRDRPLRDH